MEDIIALKDMVRRYSYQDIATCEQLCSRGVDICRHIGFDFIGIAKGSRAAVAMSIEARHRRKKGYRSIKSLRSRGIVASLQSIGATGKIKRRARKALRLGLSKIGLVRNVKRFPNTKKLGIRKFVFKVPYYFKNQVGKMSPSIYCDYNRYGINWNSAEQMLNETICESCHPFIEQRLTLRKFERLENLESFSAYGRYESRVAELNEGNNHNFTEVEKNHDWLNRLAARNGLNRAANTVYLLHGTKRKHVNSILQNGLRTSFSLSSSPIYGKGIYFSDKACKSHQYTDDSEDHCILICRVVLGRSELLLSDLNSSFRLFPAPNFDSAVAMRSVTTRNGGLQEHNEYIVYQDCACYPEFLLSYDST